MSYGSINGLPGLKNPRVFYGTSSTAASTQNKALMLAGYTALAAGDVFFVTFENAQSYNGTPKLKINSLEAQPIRRVTGDAAKRYEWQGGETLTLVWNGTYFLIVGGGIADTTYYGRTKLTSALDSTSEVLAATAKAVKLAYDEALNKLGLYIDASGHLCQQINGDT